MFSRRNETFVENIPAQIIYSSGMPNGSMMERVIASSLLDQNQNQQRIQMMKDCGIDVDNIQKIIMEINSIVQNGEVNGNTLTSNVIYNKIAELTNLITKYDSQKIKCVLEKTVDTQYCSTEMRPLNNISMEQLDIFNESINKYKPILKNWYNWIVNNYGALEQDCGTDINKINKLKQIISNMTNIAA